MFSREVKEGTETVQNLPEQLESDIEEALRLQVTADYYKKSYNDKRAGVFETVKQDPNLTLHYGGELRTVLGSLLLTERSSREYDTEVMVQYLREGKISIEDFVGCISTFNHQEIDAVFGDLARTFVSDSSAKTVYTMKATPVFKQTVQATLDKENVG